MGRIEIDGARGIWRIALALALLLGIAGYFNQVSFGNYLGLLARLHSGEGRYSPELEQDEAETPAGSDERGFLVVASDLREGLFSRGPDRFRGFYVDLIEEATEGKSISYRLFPLPMHRSVWEARNGRPIVVFGLSQGFDEIRYSRHPIFESPVYLYAPVDSDIAALRGNVEIGGDLRVGFVDGYRYGGRLEELSRLESGVGSLYPSRGYAVMERLIDALMVGRIDTVAAAPTLFQSSLLGSGFRSSEFARISDEPVGRIALHAACSQEADEEAVLLVDSIDGWLMDPANKNRLEELKQLHGLSDGIE